ncbi:MAG: M28 family peptidase [Deltaproteobacteria bacterium]|nr:MAG: M28 family peptidase [Deltaproteobacteria bacterium]
MRRKAVAGSLLWALAGLLFITASCVLHPVAAKAAYSSRDLAQQFAEFKDRSTGTPGCRKAADLIYQTFSDLGFQKVGRHPFLLPVNQYQEASLTINGRRTPIKPLQLNALSLEVTPASGLEGPLLYVGTGRSHEFNGMEVNGSIILMEMDSGKNWLNAAMLGAKALIYVDRGPTAKWFFTEKRELTSLNFPRFWMPLTQARSLFGSFENAAGGVVVPRVVVTSSGAWKRIKSENIYALVEGNDPQLKEQLLVVEAFYDSTPIVTGVSPGTDEASSIASLLHLARRLRGHPPGRSVLLVATSGHAQGLAGIREFIWATHARSKEQKKLNKELKKRIEGAEAALEVLSSPKPLDQLSGEQAVRLREVLDDQVKSEVDSLSQRLMQLRLEKQDDADQQLIANLAARRFLLRRLSWRSSYQDVTPDERRTLLALIPAAIRTNQAILEDSREQMKCLKSSRRLRRLLGDYDLPLFVSLHLSSHGDGVGGFNDGFLYDLKPQINRTATYGHIDQLLNRIGREAEKRLGLPRLFQDTLRPNPLRTWQSYLPDRPLLGGEVSALAGILGLSLVTLNDARPFWGTPYDQPERVDWAYFNQQSELVASLVEALSREPRLASDLLPRKGFATLSGEANFIRQGELFPDQPASGTLILAYQGPGQFYSMVDTAGSFQFRGLADSKHTIHKAILEGFRFDPKNGEVIWAVDKPMTGKAAYRVKMRRRFMETELIMFACRVSTLFSLIEPRTFSYMTKIKLIDGRTEAKPLRYWWSRIDTRSSILASIYLEPLTPFKLTLSDSVLTRKLILLNSKKSRPDGTGYRVENWPIIPATEYRIAHDMWSLLLPRITALESHGINNQRIRSLQQEGVEALQRAEEALSERRYDRFVEEAKKSWALAIRVYDDVEKTQKDVLFGVLFYVALFVPFAYCVERLLFSFVDIHRRIIAFLVILGLVIALIYQVHPAFQLTYSPVVVILAFFILGLSVMVALIIMNRFEQEMVELQQRARHIKASEISKTKAFVAAFVLGVSNLRRRPIRTVLTCVTLIILTFTIMSFTTVKSLRLRGRLQLQKQAPYEGFLLKVLNWESLPPQAFTTVANKFKAQGEVVPRSWLENEDRTQPMVVSLRREGREVLARGTVGLSDREPQVSGLGTVLSSGRWFEPEERRVVLLSERLAQSLGVSLERPERATVTLWGMTFKVVGLFRGDSLQSFLDLDGEPLTPVIFPSEAAKEVTEVEMEAIEAGEDVQAFQSRYQHVAGDLTLIVPYQTLMALGGSLKSLAISPQSGVVTRTTAMNLVDRFGLTLFSGEEEGTFMYHASDALSYSGVPNILIPLLIAVLIVLNTMIGSVYERKREIGVYTSVGLAPFHVSFLFIAEAMAFAVLSVVLGYLLAQTSAEIFSTTSLWQGITVNYSSLAGVAAMILVMLVVLVSVIYPSKVAADIAIPDVYRAWKLPEPEENEIKITLPFLLKYREQKGIGGYLREYYLGHRDVSHGLFTTDDISLEFYCPIDEISRLEAPGHCENDCIQIYTRVWLAPFDFGVKQLVSLQFCPAVEDPDNYLEIQVRVEREAGEANYWKRINKAFLNDLRKQLLVWRSLDDEAQAHYSKLLETEFSSERLTAMSWA